MSNAPDIIASRNRVMRTVSFCCITNTIAEDGTNATNHEEVVRILGSYEVSQRFTGTTRGFFKLYREQYM